MRFSRAEFVRGAITAWLWFLAIHQLALLVPMGGYGFLALTLTLPWSFGALLVGSLPAYLIGRALRTEHRRWVHEVTFGVFGFVVGVLTTALAVWLTGGGLGDFAGWWWIAAVVAASACPAVVLGWRFGARDARRSESGREPRGRLDPDAEYEDSLAS
jgi:CDP-diglyceride synthetase